MAWRHLGCSFIGSAILLLAALPAEAGKLTYWRFNDFQRRLDLITDEGVQPKAMLLSNPTRLVLDLPNTKWLKPDAEQDTKGKFEQVRVAQYNPQTTRVVVEVDDKYTLDSSEIKVQRMTDTRWFVQFPKPRKMSKDERRAAPRQSSIAIAVPLPPPKVATRPVTQPAARPATKPASRPAAKPAPRPAANPTPRPVAQSRYVVVLDAGHGGGDPGAVGIRGIQEKRVVLAITQEVQRLLAAKGLKVIMTRWDDREIDLQPRVNVAERNRATIFVSIHANAISLSRPDINGLETYYYSTGGRLAQTIHNNVLRTVNVRDRGVRRARFYVLRYTSMPAVLVETGFVTGAEDGPRLAQRAYQQQMAQGIAAGILQYLNIK